MQNLLLVALGGAVGACARYGVGALALRLGWTSLPWGTLIVNLVGGLAMGFLAGSLGAGAANLRLLFGVGALGGFTTFSAFSIETVQLIEANQAGAALGYMAASVLLSVGACWLGLALTRGAG